MTNMENFFFSKMKVKVLALYQVNSPEKAKLGEKIPKSYYLTLEILLLGHAPSPLKSFIERLVKYLITFIIDKFITEKLENLINEECGDKGRIKCYRPDPTRTTAERRSKRSRSSTAAARPCCRLRTSKGRWRMKMKRVDLSVRFQNLRNQWEKEKKYVNLRSYDSKNGRK